MGGGEMSGSVLYDAPGPQDDRAAPALQRRRPGAGPRVPRLRGLEVRRRGAVRVRPVGAVRHPGLHLGAARRRRAQDAADGVHVHHRRRRVRRALRRRQAQRPPLGALALLAGRGVLPGRAAAAADHLHLLQLRHRRRVRPLLVGRHRPDALQRVRAGRGLPRRHPGRAEGTVRGGVRHRHAQDPGDDHGAAAAGREDHAAGDHQPVRGGAEGHQPRLRDRGSRPDDGSASPSTPSSSTRSRR